MKTLPPEIASEVSSRLLAGNEELRIVLALDEVRLRSDDLEKLLTAVWVMGYGEAMGDIAAGPGPYPELVGFADTLAEVFAP